MSKATLCLWHDGTAEQAAQFYAATFPQTTVGAIQRAPSDNPSTEQGAVLVVEMTLLGMPAILLNGGPRYQPSEAFSVQIHTEDQAETDRLWNAIVANGGSESMCNWCKDRWGNSWQITPRALSRWMADPDPAARKRVFDAMMTMGKIDIAAIEAARKGDS
ncbi:MAG: VOC family protein [Novosphingobium sp.]|uniref:VOC family protein n=1 Tax=Novosphingobium sp. TaxID=1874826 RepID=UPI0032BD5EEE